jgi:AraC-like DNA-binding protein
MVVYNLVEHDVVWCGLLVVEYVKKLLMYELEVVNYVIDNYKNNISLVEAAKIVNMSESAFSRYFMKTTGNRFSEFVSRIRLGRACVMLYETDKNISTIAFSSGYNNLANFNRQFVKLKGITPREYRKTAYKGLISE